MKRRPSVETVVAEEAEAEELKKFRRRFRLPKKKRRNKKKYHARARNKKLQI